MSQQSTILALRQCDVVQYGLEDGINEYEEYQEYIFQYDSQNFFEFLQKQISLLSYETPLEYLEELNLMILKFSGDYCIDDYTNYMYQDFINCSIKEIRILKEMPNAEILQKMWVSKGFKNQKLVRDFDYCCINHTIPDTFFSEIPDIEYLRKLWRRENG